MNDDKDDVRRYYAAFGEREWSRLASPEGQIEFAVTTHALSKYLPPSGRILDIGGATGRYTIWLAQRGYVVALADLSPELLRIARAKIADAGCGANVESIQECDACSLSRFGDGWFDAVVCLGPFYHLTSEADRKKAQAELLRVLKPGGTAFVALMPIYGFLGRTLATKAERRHFTDPEFVRRLMDEGVFINDVPGSFSQGFGVRPLAVAPMFAGAGFTTVTVMADTGFAVADAHHLAELAKSDPAAHQVAMDLIIATASDPSLLGGAQHILYVGTKPDR
jgi:SAM-dependent methyltransferase